MIVPDAELSPVGPASDEVIFAWRERFKRMSLLRSFCGPAFDKVREEFLSCLGHPEHRSRAQVYCAVGEVVKVRHDPPAGRGLPMLVPQDGHRRVG